MEYSCDAQYQYCCGPDESEELPEASLTAEVFAQTVEPPLLHLPQPCEGEQRRERSEESQP